MPSRRSSHRGNLTERMILIPLRLAERPHSRQELAHQFGVDAKTISRDIDVLSQYHPITEEKEGREIHYLFREGYQYTSPNFTPGELAILLLAQQSIATTGLTSFGTPFAGYEKTLLQKVRSALPQSLRDKLDALATIFGTAQFPAKDYAPHAETIDRLTDAAVSRQRVRLRYHTLHNDRVGERNFDPYAVYFDPDGATLKVIGLDHKSQEIRPLSIDRILAIKETTDKFTRPAEFDLAQFLSDNCFNGIHGEPLTVRLRTYGVTARIFAERIFHPSQHTIERTSATAREEESTTIEMHVARGRGLVRFILSYLPDIEVLAPPALRQEVKATLQRGGRRFEDE
jgi:predicted DNA-binding transcriptional regulator YafY